MSVDIWSAMGEIKVEHLGTLKHAFQQLEADWCQQLAAGAAAKKGGGGLRGKERRERRRAVRSAAKAAKQQEEKSHASPRIIENKARPRSPNSLALHACTSAPQQQQQQQQQARPQCERSARHANNIGPGSSPPHADMKRKAPGDGAFKAGGGGKAEKGPNLEPSRPKKKKPRPPWQDNSIPCAPKPFTSDSDPSGSDGQDLSSAPPTEGTEATVGSQQQPSGSGKAAPPAPLTDLPPTNSPSARYSQPPSPSRIPRQPDSGRPLLGSSSLDTSKSRIPHLPPSPQPAQANSCTSSHQRKHWSTSAAPVEQAEIGQQVPHNNNMNSGAVRPPQLGRRSPVHQASPPLADAASTLPPPAAATPSPRASKGETASGVVSPPPASTPIQPVASSSPAQPSPFSALRASAMESLKEGRNRALQNRASARLKGAAEHRRSLSAENLISTFTREEKTIGAKRGSIPQLPAGSNKQQSFLSSTKPSPAPDQPAATSPKRPRSASQPIIEPEPDTSFDSANIPNAPSNGTSGPGTMPPTNSSLASAVAALHYAQGAALPGSTHKEGYLRKLSALKRTVPPQQHPQGTPALSTQRPKPPRAHLPPVLEPTTDQGSGIQQLPALPALHTHFPRPVSEPAGSTDGRPSHDETQNCIPRRVSDLGSPTRLNAPASVMDGAGPDSQDEQCGGEQGLSRADSRVEVGFGLDGMVSNSPALPTVDGQIAGGRSSRARWQVAPDPKYAAWRLEADPTLARSTSSPFPKAQQGSALEQPQGSAFPHPLTAAVPGSSKSPGGLGTCRSANEFSLPPASPMLANSPSRPAARPSSPSSHSSLQKPPTTHQEINAALASAAAAGFTPPVGVSSALSPRFSASGTHPTPSYLPPHKPASPLLAQPQQQQHPHISGPFLVHPTTHAWLPPHPDHNQQPIHQQGSWTLPSYNPPLPASFTPTNSNPLNPSVQCSMSGGQYQPASLVPPYTNQIQLSSYPSQFTIGGLSTSSSPAGTPPWMTLKDTAAHANGGGSREHQGSLDAALVALQQQQQQQQHGKRVYANDQLQEPSRIMDIMRMSSSQLTAGWETAAPHEAAMGPLSRFADVWQQRNRGHAEHRHFHHQQHERQQHAHYQQYQQQQQQQQQPAQATMQHQSHQLSGQQQGGGGSCTPPPVDRRQLKLQSAFNGLTLGEVMANSVKKAPPFPKRQGTSKAQQQQQQGDGAAAQVKQK